MKVFTKSFFRLFILSTVICLMMKPIYNEEVDEGEEKELVEDDLADLEDEENDAEIEEESESDIELFDDDDEEDDEGEDEEFVMHKGISDL